MSRLSLQVINQLAETLRILILDFNELKNRQPTSGRSGVLGYLSQTLNEWDLVETVSSPSPSFGYGATFEITFEGDGSQRYPIINPFAEVLLSSDIDKIPRKAEYNPANGFLSWSDGTNGVTFSGFLEADTDNKSSVYKYKWVIYMSYFGSNITYRLKAFTRGTSRGTITVARTY